MNKKTEYEKYIEKVLDSKKYSEEKKEEYLNQIKILKEKRSKVILNTYHFSNLVGIKWKCLKKIINDPDKYYYNFDISKKSGGKRKINVPNDLLEICQRFIKEKILCNVKIHFAANGFATEKSIVTNANKHINQDMILNIDLKDFFPSISSKKVFYVFHNICGYNNDLSHCFTKLVMYNGGLPQGACTSPIISNIVSYKLDLRLEKLSKKLGIVYTRYADDITFSGDNNIINNNFLKLVTKIITECGYIINDKKTRFQSKYGKQEVTGLIVNNGVVSVSNIYIKKIRQELYYIKKFGLYEHKKKNGIRNKFYNDHLKGKIMFVYSINNEKGKKLLDSYNEIFNNNI